MKFMVIVTADGQTIGAVTRNKRQAFSWRNSVFQTIGGEVNVKAWRYHDGSGWTEGGTNDSSFAYQHIQSLPSRVNVEIFR